MGKHRPCLIAVLFPDQADPAKQGVIYLPITHTPPSPPDAGMELSADAKFAAGLDSQRQWLLVSEGNRDTWPDDLANLPNQPGLFHYGFLPPKILKSVQSAFAQNLMARKFGITNRNPPP